MEKKIWPMDNLLWWCPALRCGEAITPSKWEGAITSSELEQQLWAVQWARATAETLSFCFDVGAARNVLERVPKDIKKFIHPSLDNLVTAHSDDTKDNLETTIEDKAAGPLTHLYFPNSY